MTSVGNLHEIPLETKATALSLVTARLAGRSLPDFPGTIPTTLAAGYAYQDAAISLWPDQIAGWKVGYIAPSRRDDSHEDRVTGPVFSRAVWPAIAGGSVAFPVFTGGFAAVEAEYIFILGKDADPGNTDWTSEEAARLVRALHIGIETAGSPLATINKLGPAVVASDFGNNAGLIMGPEITNWQRYAETALVCETFIENISVGTGGAASVPGGLLAALVFALNRCARRGFPLKKGSFVTTGAATGIHDIKVGQKSRIEFGAFGAIDCHAVVAVPFEPSE
ncbi:MAG: 2-keto-4-pentenoate hydratase [Arenimonas sp.]